MPKGRLEAFSDGVIALVITIMVLELRPPHAPTLAALAPLAPTFLAYVLSCIYLGIYWNNHHHMLQAATKGVTGPILWAKPAPPLLALPDPLRHPLGARTTTPPCPSRPMAG